MLAPDHRAGVNTATHRPRGVLEVDRARTKCRAVEGKQVITDFARYTAAALPTRIRAREW